MIHPSRVAPLVLLLGAAAGSGDPAAQPPADGAKPVVVVETSKGRIKIELDPEKAPRTVKNFLAYVDDKFYDGTIFHRVIKGFMIQGGGFDAEKTEKPTRPPIPNEAKGGLPNVRGTISMARTSDPDSATGQFFISTGDNRRTLDPNPGSAGYCAFGRVVAGMDVVDAIAGVPTANVGAFEALPREPILIKSVRRAE